MFSKIKNKTINLYRRYILRDKLLLEFVRWFRDKGDETLRLDYPLQSSSVVFDVGGYHGDFAAAIYDKFKCKVFIFEPVPQFHEQCVERFKGNSQIVCLNYGLSSEDGWFDIALDDNSSSFTIYKKDAQLIRGQTRSITQCIRELNIDQIDLMKINIEGGEFDVIPALIHSDDISKINFLQVQFHSFIPNAIPMREAIRMELPNTHTEMWNYEFVWESWCRKK